jgi:hypothetical protein
MRLGYSLARVLLAAALDLLPPSAQAQVRFPPPATLSAPGRAVANASLTFVVSVCLEDFEYSIGCRERSSLEAARRLEQIFLDDYATGSPAGSLRIWFAVKAEASEQLTFLREVENRAIAAAFRKLKEDAEQNAASAADSSGASGGSEEAAQQFAQDIQRWNDDASAEARAGSNWSHNWSARSHTYKPGQALRDLARIGSRTRQRGD